jgi:hypothetical protein
MCPATVGEQSRVFCEGPAGAGSGPFSFFPRIKSENYWFISLTKFVLLSKSS